MARGTWTWAGLAVAAAVVVAAAWTLLADDGPAPDVPVDVVGPSDRETGEAGDPLVAPGVTPGAPRAARAERPEAEAVPLAGPASEWPQLKGIAIDVANEKPVGDFTYWVVPHDGSDPIARLDEVPGNRHSEASGVFRSRQRPGLYDVVIEAPGFLRCVRTALEVPMPTRKAYGFKLETGAGIAGTVFTEQGMPARDVPVFLHVQRLEPASDPPRTAATRTDRDGRFQFTPLDPGQYAVSLLEPDNRRDRLGAIYVESSVTPVDLTLATRHQLTLRFRDEAGRPVGGARVELVGDGRVASAVATSGGLAVLEHVGDGRYSLRVDREGFEPHVEDLVLEGGFGQTMRWIGLVRSPPR